MTRVRAAAIVAASLLTVVALFQIALGLGAPAGEYAWGGRNPGRLPTRLRVTSLVAGVILYPILILLLLTAAAVVDLDLVPDVAGAGMWALAGLFVVGGILNLISPSKKERLWGPVSLAIAICCGVVAAAL